VTCSLVIGHQYLGGTYCAYFSIFYMEEEYIFETLVYTYQSTRRHKPGGHHTDLYRCEILNFRTIVSL